MILILFLHSDAGIVYAEEGPNHVKLYQGDNKIPILNEYVGDGQLSSENSTETALNKVVITQPNEYSLKPDEHYDWKRIQSLFGRYWVTGRVVNNDEALYEYLNVVTEGADPTGTNDNSDLINNLMALNPGCVLYFPSGTYRFDNPLIFDNQEEYGITLQGVNQSETIFKFNVPDGTSMLSLGKSARCNINDICFLNSNNNTAFMIYAGVNAHLLKIKDCTFLNCNRGITIKNSAYSYVDNCIFYSGSSPNVFIDYDSGEYIYLTNTTFYGYINTSILDGTNLENYVYGDSNDSILDGSIGISLKSTQVAYLKECVFEGFDQAIQISAPVSGRSTHTLNFDCNSFINNHHAIYTYPDEGNVSRMFINNSYFQNEHFVTGDALTYHKVSNYASSRFVFDGCSFSGEVHTDISDDSCKAVFDIYPLNQEESFSRNMPRGQNDITEVKVISIADTGKKTEPELKVYAGIQELEKGKDYLAVYDNYLGECTKGTVVGVGNYTGKITFDVTEFHDVESLQSKIINVAEHGILPGTEDISSKLNVLIEQSYGNVLFFPNGTYIIKNPVIINNEDSKGITLRGESERNTIFQISEDITQEAIKCFNGTNVIIEKARILAGNDNGILNCDNANNLTLNEIQFTLKRYGVNINNANGTLLNYCNMNLSGDGYSDSYYLKVNSSPNIKINRSTFDYFQKTSGGTAIILNCTEKASFIDCDICNFMNGIGISIAESNVVLTNTVMMRCQKDFLVDSNDCRIDVENSIFITLDVLTEPYILFSEYTLDTVKIHNSYLINDSTIAVNGCNNSDIKVITVGKITSNIGFYSYPV